MNFWTIAINNPFLSTIFTPMRKTVLLSLLLWWFLLSLFTYAEDYCAQSAWCRSTPENPLQICADLQRLCANQRLQENQNTTTNNTPFYNYTQTLTPLEQCRNQFWVNATTGPEIDKCYCKNGYVWNKSQTSCEVATASNTCADPINAYLDNNWDCFCKEGYMRNEKKYICVKWNNEDIELQNAILWMYEKWLTIYNTMEKFMWEEYLTREQASKFFVQFGKKILEKTVDNTKKVQLSDINKADITLQPYIKEANQLGLFKWVNGNFLPFNKLTRAQAIAVIIRANNWFQDETQNQWYKKYYDIVNNYWMLEGLGFNINTLDSNNIKRKEVALLLYRLNNYIEREDSSIKLCQSTYWEFSNSEWIVNSSWAYDCTCREWYGFNKDTKCIEATDKTSCQDIYWKYSYTDYTLDNVWWYNCYCQEWYDRESDAPDSPCIKK